MAVLLGQSYRFSAGSQAVYERRRLSLASGRLREAIVGPAQFQSMTVMGEPVVIANSLCSGAPRDRSIILADSKTVAAIEPGLITKPVPLTVLKRLKGTSPSAFEIIGVANPRSWNALH